jgi:hypothetical protein
LLATVERESLRERSKESSAEGEEARATGSAGECRRVFDIGWVEGYVARGISTPGKLVPEINGGDLHPGNILHAANVRVDAHHISDVSNEIFRSHAVLFHVLVQVSLPYTPKLRSWLYMPDVSVFAVWLCTETLVLQIESQF